MHAPRARTSRYIAGTVIALAIAFALGGCGKGSAGGSRSSANSQGGESGDRGPGVAASNVAVIKGWADALRHGQSQRAAGYWAHPSAMVNGTDSAGRIAVIRIDSLHDALLADQTLPCGATLQRTSRRGPYVRAEFTLSARTGAGSGSSSECAGPASVDFLIRSGHIVRWLRAPVASVAPESGEGEQGKEPGAGETPGAQSI
jgi:hypothetical protein